MKRFQLTAGFVLATIAIAASLPLAFGITPETIVASVLIVAASGLLVEPGHTHYRGGMRAQFGKVGSEEDIEAQYKEVQTNLKDIGDKLKAHAEQSEKDIKAHRSMSEETKAKVDELLTTQGGLQENLRALEQTMAGLQDSANAGPAKAQTGGQLLAAHIEEHEDARAFLANPVQGQTMRVAVPRSAFQAALTDTSGGGSSLTYPADNRGLVAPLQRRLTIRDLLMPGRTSSSAIFFPRESGFTNNAGIQSSQGGLKGKSEITFEDVTRAVATIAHTLDVSIQMLSDVPYLMSYLDGRGMHGLKLKEELQLLLGSGTGGNLEGLFTAAAAYAQPAGAVVTDETPLDRLRLMMLQVELAEAMATGVVLNPVNWANIELQKDANKQYLFTNPQNTTTGRIWGRDVVSTQSMPQGQTVVGDFATHAQLLDREDASVAISYENKDNFERNMATIRIEERAVLAIYRDEAFVKGPLSGS
ncbi:phage major capsid protein [Alcanivorax sp. S6407]|uniref:phage major capsid protein n=1 Tax=Alcanivorax sp. S6407 TaxID=2926424 RepID=UPI001FF6D804|nr:phage major capsid protein [Alcanivorax sp. S6407]MCK0153865.1 phage major capsid protein [Alcanivorax sp. S6407]